MNHSDPWSNLDGTTRALLRQVQSLGYTVSVHRLAGSLLGSRPATVEMHAVASDGVQHIVSDDTEDAYLCACRLARSVGIRLRG